MKPSQAKEPLALGDRLSNRYLIVERIASGGHSIVYRGEDQRLSRPVCVKVFHRLNPRGAVYQTAYEHFVQEAFALSKLTHPNTLRIYDFGYLGEDQSEYGPPFQISEFMNHGTLATLVQRSGPLEPADAVRVITALGGALSEAHEHGIIHRDIKPQNILFGVVGRNIVAKLADFGIAKSLAERAERLHNQAEDTAVVAGRPLLMYSLRWAAPEQLSGDPVVRASDTYSLALTLVYALTGNVVFISSEQMDPYEQRKRSDEFIEAACAGQPLPTAVIDGLKAGCAFEPADRPQDVEDFASGLVAGFEARDKPAAPALQAISSGAARGTGPVFARAATPTPTPPRRLHTSDEVHSIGDRRGCFIPAAGGTADVTCCNGAARLRLTFVPAPDGFCLHIKGMNCFVARARGRPSSAVQFERDGRCDLVTPNRRQLANVGVSMGTPAAGHRVFTVGTESVALSTEECPEVAMLDFGAGNDCLFVYRPSHANTQPKRSLWRKSTS